ncbi:unnamed protein product [Dicrocoelium dendriticum]|nr:unnamed protein product [Dicrocoelium dendriticum]
MAGARGVAGPGCARGGASGARARRGAEARALAARARGGGGGGTWGGGGGRQEAGGGRHPPGARPRAAAGGWRGFTPKVPPQAPNDQCLARLTLAVVGSLRVLAYTGRPYTPLAPPTCRVPFCKYKSARH